MLNQPKHVLNRRTFLKQTALGTAGLAWTASKPGRLTAHPNAADMTFYIGTYTSGRSEGIYCYRMNPETGALQYLNKTTGVDNPSFLALDPQQRYLYAVNELTDYEGAEQGAVSAFSIEAETGALSLINKQPSHGGAPCHISVDATGKWVLVANYVGGNVAVYPIQEGGGLGPASHVVQHEGSSINPRRQEGPHAHQIILSADNRYAFAADLGLDKIMIYRLDTEQGKLMPHDPPFAEVPAGAGPRHVKIHPGGRFAYVINEMGSSVSAFTYEDARLTRIQTVRTLPEGYTGSNSCADLHIAPNGRFLYGSNRGHNSLAIYSIDASTGHLTPVGHQSTLGETPRNFAIDPTGTFVLAANQRTNSVVTFRIDPTSGLLEPTGYGAEVPTPVCLVFIDPVDEN